jgi:predicted dienelactone hydrolase
MRAIRTCLVVSAALTLAFVLKPSACAQDNHRYKVGMVQRAFSPSGAYYWRGAQTHALLTTIWYPAGSGADEQPQWLGNPQAPFAGLGKAAPDAALAPAPARFPLIVLSHGTGGSAPMMAWLGTELAAHGYIAAAVNHPGNNGTETYTTQGFVMWWERAKDLSNVIDQMLADKTFGSRIDAKRIGAAGFSLGGYTMIEIAGGITQPSLFRDFCKSPQADGICVSPPEFPDLVEKFAQTEELAKDDPEMQASFRHASDSYRDPRVRAVFAIAPALGPAFRPDSLKKINIPVAIVAGDADTNVPVASSAQFFAKHIPHAQLTLLPGVGHYTFLAVCADQGKKSRPELCIDAAGVDREAVHAKAAGLALDFFAAHLGPALWPAANGLLPPLPLGFGQHPALWLTGTD